MWRWIKRQFFQLQLCIIFDSCSNDVKSGFLRRKSANIENLVSERPRHWCSVLRIFGSLTSQGSSGLMT